MGASFPGWMEASLKHFRGRERCWDAWTKPLCSPWTGWKQASRTRWGQTAGKVHSHVEGITSLVRTRGLTHTMAGQCSSQRLLKNICESLKCSSNG